MRQLALFGMAAALAGARPYEFEDLDFFPSVQGTTNVRLTVKEKARRKRKNKMQRNSRKGRK